MTGLWQKNVEVKVAKIKNVVNNVSTSKCPLLIDGKKRKKTFFWASISQKKFAYFLLEISDWGLGVYSSLALVDQSKNKFFFLQCYYIRNRYLFGVKFMNCSSKCSLHNFVFLQRKLVQTGKKFADCSLIVAVGTIQEFYRRCLSKIGVFVQFSKKTKFKPAEKLFILFKSWRGWKKKKLNGCFSNKID